MSVSAWRLLEPGEKVATTFILIASVISSAVELAALSTAVPFVGLLVDPDSLDRFPLIGEFFAMLGLSLDNDAVLLAGVLVIASLTVAFLFRTAIFFAVERFSARFANRLVDDLIRGCLFGPYAWLRTQNGALLAQRLSIDASSVGHGLLSSILDLSYSLFILIIGIVVVVTASSWMTIVVLGVFAVIVAIALSVLNPLSARLSSKQRLHNIRSMQEGIEALEGSKVLRVTGTEGYFVRRFVGSWGLANYARMNLNLVNKLIPTTILLIGQIGMLTLAMSLFALDLPNELIVTQLTFILLVLVRVLPAVSSISGSVNRLVKLEPFFRGYAELREQVLSWGSQDEREAKPGRPVDLSWSTLTFDNVEFGFADSDRVQLKAISFSLQYGQHYGFVGPSGAGKSTLLDILLGLLEPTNGRVLLDQQPLQGRCRAAWLAAIGYVPQEPFIIDDSLRRNVAFGIDDADVSDDKIWKALELAELASLVRDWPDGLATSLGDGGARLSGGQRQRVAIARALYFDPQILVFDEATSALDLPTENAIRKTIAKLSGQRTTVTITHRLATLSDCDRIFILVDGEISASGTFEQLSRENRSFQLLSNSP